MAFQKLEEKKRKTLKGLLSGYYNLMACKFLYACHMPSIKPLPHKAHRKPTIHLGAPMPRLSRPEIASINSSYLNFLSQIPEQILLSLCIYDKGIRSTLALHCMLGCYTDYGL